MQTMFYEKRNLQFTTYHQARNYFIRYPQILIELERWTAGLLNQLIAEHMDELRRDYNEASYLHPFWANYPPEDRGRAPVGDQVPWIEVGEHAIGHKLSRLIAARYPIAEIGLPSGAGNRFVLYSEEIRQITHGLTNGIFLFLDIKSVGPRDNFEHTVISPYQVSGDGLWDKPETHMHNTALLAQGRQTTHTFYPAVSPIYSFSDKNTAPVVHIFVKPIYQMLTTDNKTACGQPLASIKNICLPNGLLLTCNPNYLKQYPGLFFPGKDDKRKDPRKIRVRVSFDILRRIALWRVTEQ